MGEGVLGVSFPWKYESICPFYGGNGRTSRLIMNYQLMANNYLPVSIPNENKFSYYSVLEQYAVNGNLQPFIELIAELEIKQLNNFLDLM